MAELAAAVSAVGYWWASWWQLTSIFSVTESMSLTLREWLAGESKTVFFICYYQQMWGSYAWWNSLEGGLCTSILAHYPFLLWDFPCILYHLVSRKNTVISFTLWPKQLIVVSSDIRSGNCIYNFTGAKLSASFQLEERSSTGAIWIESERGDNWT